MKLCKPAEAAEHVNPASDPSMLQRSTVIGALSHSAAGRATSHVLFASGCSLFCCSPTTVKPLHFPQIAKGISHPYYNRIFLLS